MQASHFKYNHEKNNRTRISTLKKISSMKAIDNKDEIYKTLTIDQFLENAKKDIIRTRKRPIIKSVLKNSNGKKNEKLQKIRKIINQNLNKDEIMLIRDKNDIDYKEILEYQENCENALELVFKEKMKKIFEIKQNRPEEFSSSEKTNFNSNEEISFGSIHAKNNQKDDYKEKLDKEYDEKYCDIFFEYANNFDDMDGFNKIYAKYMRCLCDELLGKINGVLYPISNKKVRFKKGI